jgi:AcrR family transcriptional regulator
MSKQKQLRGEAVRQKLLDVAEGLLGEKDAGQLRLEELLAKAGIARNTLYKHFGDLDHLVEESFLRAFQRNVELDAQAMGGALNRCRNREDFKRALTKLTRATQSADRAPQRMLRIRLIALAATRPALMERVSAIQAELTGQLTRELLAAQEKGFVRDDVPANSVADLMQAYTLGRVLIDIEPHSRKTHADWVNLIDRLTEWLLTD